MQKTISILLSLLLLVSTTGLTYGQHFCEGVVVDKSFAIGFETMSCADVEADDACENNPAEDDCCSDVYFQVQTDEDFLTSSFNLDINPVFIVAFVEVFVLQSVEIQSLKVIAFSVYLPPPLEKDITVLYESFLI